MRIIKFNFFGKYLLFQIFIQFSDGFYGFFLGFSNGNFTFFGSLWVDINKGLGFYDFL